MGNVTDYPDAARRLPRPTVGQLCDFAEYVAQEHSWYKHLPLIAPGIPFVFYLDPNAGCDLLIGPGGTTTYRERTESTHRFLHESLLTDVYRERFGYLEYFTPAGSWIFGGNRNGLVVCTRGPWPAIYVGAAPATSPGLALWRMIRRLTGKGKLVEIPEKVRNGESVMKSYCTPTSFVSKRGWLGVPEEVLRAGYARLTGVIHPFSSQISLWKHGLSAKGGGNLQWPEESGGQSTVEKLRTIVQNVPQDAEAQLDLLLEPERSRQKGLIVRAMETMLTAVYH
jgi:hypothetical protein